MCVHFSDGFEGMEEWQKAAEAWDCARPGEVSGEGSSQLQRRAQNRDIPVPGKPPKIAAVVQGSWVCIKEMLYVFCGCQSQRDMTATVIRNREEEKFLKPHTEIYTVVLKFCLDLNKTVPWFFFLKIRKYLTCIFKFYCNLYFKEFGYVRDWLT